MNILEEANTLIHGDRQKTYDPPFKNFSNIAKMWSIVLSPILKEGAAVNPFQVALCMVMLKIARLIASPIHRDSLVDGAGYFGCAEEVLAEMVKEENQNRTRRDSKD